MLKIEINDFGDGWKKIMEWEEQEMMPTHIGIIMMVIEDGQKKGMPISYGHKEGGQNLRKNRKICEYNWSKIYNRVCFFQQKIGKEHKKK